MGWMKQTTEMEEVMRLVGHYGFVKLSEVEDEYGEEAKKSLGSNY
jgi:tRNA A58 N-methylase Trm61